MLESMACGLPVLQRYDELNADQIMPGVNGFFFHTAQEMADYLRGIKALTPEELAERKARVRSTVVDRGSANLAAYMLQMYERAQEEHAAAHEERRKIG
jgi:1,2-diacylglycerol 3-alpha-glucosyltransferase